ncbi:MAG: preprotein translocase subunit SecY [Alphaproteobacteria bacterium]|jgi:preprotein translocase subunit SecY|nr:preprotein translocase subunit SecY [Alphaproteobacteria bacterium]
MASAIEQFASNVNLGVFSKATELKQRLWFTFIALIIYRIGTHIPLPGIDPAAWNDIFAQKTGGVLDMFNMFSGGALERMSIFTLNIMPYISASIIMQLLTSMNPQLEAMKKEGESGRKRLNQYTRYGTIFLAALQAYGLAVGLENMQSSAGSAVINAGIYFRITTVITIVGGTVFLMWLGEQITSRGVGNGISLIIFAGIVAGIPHAVASTLELGRTGAISTAVIIGILVMVVGVVAFIVFMERAQRRIIVNYPKRMVGNKMTGGEASHMPLKLNTSGVIPPIFASSLLLLPMTIVGFSGDNGGEGWVQEMARHLQHGQPLYMATYTFLIVFFAFFYTAIVFNPDETAENLRKYGGFVPGIRPGKATGDYLDYVLTRITVIGAAYLVFICMLPEMLISEFGLPFYFGGTSLLITVSVMMDTVAQIHSHLLAHQYEGLIKKAKLRGARK